MFKKVKSKGIVGWLILAVVIVFACIILPPLLKGIQSMAKGVGTFGDAVGNVVGGVSDEAQRILAALGLAKDPYAEGVMSAVAPGPDSYWNPEYWSNNSSGNTLFSPDDVASQIKGMRDAEGFLGYDKDTVQSILIGLGTKASISFFCWSWMCDKTDTGWEFNPKNESFPHWLLHGWWVRMSTKDLSDIIKQCDKLS